MSENEQHEQVARWLKQARKAAAFTGAGISTESGIPDFRSPGGIWSRRQPVLFQDFLASAEARHEYWEQKSAAHQEFAAAEPNEGHHVLARWESQGVIEGVITQNIDGLHQQAGSRQIVELHGTARAVGCVDCNARFDAKPLVAEFLKTDVVPPCPECGGRLKHATISFGQALNPKVLDAAIELAQDCDLLLAMGSSLVVEPAASIPRLARQSGARLVIINRDPTDHDASADMALHAEIGSTLGAIDRALADQP